MEDIQCILGVKSTSSLISEERKIDFCCDSTLPVELDYCEDVQMLTINFKYNDQRLFNEPEGDVFANANLPGWEKQLDLAEAAQIRRSDWIKKDKDLKKQFETGFFFFFFLNVL
jgi:hypothetical protein